MTIEHAKDQRWGKKPARAEAPVSGTMDEFRIAYPPHPGRRMSEEEFLAWMAERTRAEWVNGEVIIMSPVNYDHDQLQTWLLRLIADFVEERELGTLCGAEFWLRIPSVPSLHLTDLFFVAQGREQGFERVAKSKVGPATCFNGAPDLVVEVVSPDSSRRDYEQKFNEYEAAGVKEYWIVDPLTLKVGAHTLKNGKFHLILEKNGAVHSKVLAGFWLRPAWLWQRPLPRKAAILREMGIK